MDKRVKLSEIVPPENYTYDPDEFKRLKESISKNGLLHPLILQGDNPPYKIVAGRARFLALRELTQENEAIHYWMLNTVILPESNGNTNEISLHENLRRHNLPWYEQVELERELHELRITQHGPKPAGRPKTGVKTGWSQNDTARELGIALGVFSEDLSLADELKRNPNLRNVKDKTTAIKLVRAAAKRTIAEMEQAIPSSTEMDEVLLGDSAVVLKSLPSNTFDCCITDPPWSEYKDEELRAEQKTLLPIFFELYRVLKSEAFLFIVTSTTDFKFYASELPKLGFRIQSYPLIWQKTKTITYGRAPWQFARDYEPIMVAVKGDPSLTSGIEVSSILKFDNVHYTKMIHPHEKPIELITNLLRLSTHPGAKIIDPFAGSGATLQACKESDRRFIGIEKEKKFYDKIVERLRK